MAGRRCTNVSLWSGLALLVYLVILFASPPSNTVASSSPVVENAHSRRNLPPKININAMEEISEEDFPSPNFILSGWPIRSDHHYRKLALLNCTEDEFYSRLRDPEETRKFQEKLFAFQHPPDCASRRFLVQGSQWGYGFGSGMYMRAYLMLRALHDGRIYLEPFDQDWAFHAKQCKGRRTSPECFFLPLSNCTSPIDWRSLPAAPEPWNTSTAHLLPQYVRAKHDLSPLSNTSSVPPLFSEYNQRSLRWWIAQMYRYQMRPNFFTRNDILLPALKKIFPLTDGILPEEFGTVFIRRGDKALEATLRPIEDFLSAAEEHSHRLNVNVLYLASDSQEAIDYVVKKYGKQFEIHFMPFERLPGGWNDTWAFRQNFPSKMSELGAVTLIDLFVSANAMFFVGSFSSNQCLLIDSLRAVSGNTCLTYTAV